GGHQSFRIDEPGQVWFIQSGFVDVFTVPLGADGPGARTSLLRVESGQLIVGISAGAPGSELGFESVASQGSQLYRLPQSRRDQPAVDPWVAAPTAAALEHWVDSLYRSLCDLPFPPESIPLETEEEVVVDPGQVVQSPDRLIWVQLLEGRSRLAGLE